MTNTTPTALATIPSSTLQLKFNRPQGEAFARHKERTTVVLPWGRGVGKSEFILLCVLLLVAKWRWVIREGMEHPGVRIVVIMPALSQAKKTVLGRFRKKLLGAWSFLGGVLHEVDLIARFPDGSYVQFVSQEQRDQIRGIRCDAVFVDEADDIEPELYADVITPWFSENHSLRIRMLGGTPMRGRKGLLFQEYSACLKGVAGYFGRKRTWRDVPEHVSLETVTEARALAARTGRLPGYHREWECDFDSAEGVVYPMFSEQFHVREPFANEWANVRPTEVLVGADWGYEDPGVFLIALVFGKGRDAIVHIAEEVYEQHKTESWWLQQARRIKERFPEAKWYGDPSQPARIEALRKEAGVKIRAANNAIEDGVDAMSDRLVVRVVTAADGETERRYAHCYVSKTCTNTIDEFSKYKRKRDPKDRERVLDDIQDRDNHAMDAARYLIFSRFGSPPGTRSDHSNYQFG